LRSASSARAGGDHDDVRRYLVAGFWGLLVSTVGIFVPLFLWVLIVAPLLAQHRENANVQSLSKQLMPQSGTS
jgi:chromate transporter